MAEIIELNQSYEQRDAYQMEVAAIEQANRKEQEEFEEQMLELGRMLENELKLPAPGARMQAAEGKSAGSTKGGDAKASGTWGGHSMSVDNSFERVQNFEEAFNKIKMATGISDVEGLVKTFIKNEDHNFSLFNYVNEQNNEIEKFEEQIQALREEERKFAQESGDDAHQHKQILKELESKLASTESMSEKYEVRCQDLQRVVESLKRGLQSIFEKLDIPMTEDADQDATSGLNDATVSETNMVHFLGVVEQKSNKLIQIYGHQEGVHDAQNAEMPLRELPHWPWCSAQDPRCSVDKSCSTSTRLRWRSTRAKTTKTKKTMRLDCSRVMSSRSAQQPLATPRRS